MKRTPLLESCLVIAQGSWNWLVRRPVVVSFEVTDSCTCWCRHCDHGGPADDPSLTPAGIRRWIRELHPAVIQISGGEPLMRDDIVECVAAAQRGGGLPYTVFVSNWSEMTPDTYVALKGAGVDQFSVSLDFPDERHDAFRGHPGLYDRLAELMPGLAALGHDDIVLNTAITSENVAHIEEIVDQAEAWGVNVSFSAYSARRTGDRSLMIQGAEQLGLLRQQLERVRARKAADPRNRIVTSSTTIEDTIRYFERGGTPDCSAGLRFLVVTADGELQPCSMHFCRFTDQRRMVEEFTATNRCDECYVSIRSYLDKSFWQLLSENVRDHFSLGRASMEPAGTGRVTGTAAGQASGATAGAGSGARHTA
ncbi:MAG: radical SAM protein [Candidatus Eiseniibacteriota bacterium]|jgi:MoaA/NifB/PqqE/SkfB family radical SAM enzyme